jgi:outer membrane protein assembly factor BamB
MKICYARRRAGALFNVVVIATVAVLSALVRAEDWPEYRGKGRAGVWKETGIIDKFPQGGLKVLWRTPLKTGLTGPSVADGRVYLTDFSAAQRWRGNERALALDEKTGKILWVREWPADYAKAKVLAYAEGPAATPTVDGNRIYVVGRTGILQALDANSGEILWTKDYAKDFQADLDPWGVGSAPIVDGPRLIALVGGANNAKVVAFDKMTGAEIWRALSFEDLHGSAAPIIITAGGVRQLIIWHPKALVSLDPATGKVYWEQPFQIYQGMIPTPPTHAGDYLLVSNFTFGSMLMKLDRTKPSATMVWKGHGESEIDTDTLNSVIGPPMINGDYIYGTCSYGQLRCLRLGTGERVWETEALLQERARYGTAFIVQNGDRYFILTDRGDLVIAKLSPGGYQEIDRTQLIKPTYDAGIRRKLTYVAWSHPAFANKHIYVRNNEEILCASLAIDGK